MKTVNPTLVRLFARQRSINSSAALEKPPKRDDVGQFKGRQLLFVFVLMDGYGAECTEHPPNRAHMLRTTKTSSSATTSHQLAVKTSHSARHESAPVSSQHDFSWSYWGRRLVTLPSERRTLQSSSVLNARRGRESGSFQRFQHVLIKPPAGGQTHFNVCVCSGVNV